VWTVRLAKVPAQAIHPGTRYDGEHEGAGYSLAPSAHLPAHRKHWVVLATARAEGPTGSIDQGQGAFGLKTSKPARIQAALAALGKQLSLEVRDAA